jgi:hypothetical protein
MDRERIRRDFTAAVNMTAGEIRQWLGTEESRSVGWVPPGGGESVGHAAGRRIAAILSAPVRELGEGDYAMMRKAVGFIRRHRAQEPANPVTSRWRYSLMNWGCDPLRCGFETEAGAKP